MTIGEARAAVESYRASLKEKAGQMVAFSDEGPVGMQAIEAVLAALETVERRVTELERRPPGGLA